MLDGYWLVLDGDRISVQTNTGLKFDERKTDLCVLLLRNIALINILLGSRLIRSLVVEETSFGWSFITRNLGAEPLGLSITKNFSTVAGRACASSDAYGEATGNSRHHCIKDIITARESKHNQGGTGKAGAKRTTTTTDLLRVSLFYHPRRQRVVGKPT